MEAPSTMALSRTVAGPRSSSGRGRATTHWEACAYLADRFPKVTVDPDPIFVRDGSISTSAGVTAGVDLAIALVEEDYGRAVAHEIARLLVVFVRRPGNQRQFRPSA